MQRNHSYLANNDRVTIFDGHPFHFPIGNRKKSEVFTCEYQVAALVTDTHKQAGSKFY